TGVEDRRGGAGVSYLAAGRQIRGSVAPWQRPALSRAYEESLPPRPCDGGRARDVLLEPARGGAAAASPSGHVPRARRRWAVPVLCLPAGSLRLRALRRRRPRPG